MRVGLTSEGRVALGNTVGTSGREGAGMLRSKNLGWDKVRARLNGEPVLVGVVGRLSEIEGREDCRLGLGMPLGRGEWEVAGASCRWY
jgi:hypothetical protein